VLKEVTGIKSLRDYAVYLAPVGLLQFAPVMLLASVDDEM